MKTTLTKAKKEKMIQARMGNKNIKNKLFNQDELEVYDMNQADIDLILEFQEKIPILQGINDDWIDARSLHQHLNIRKDFTEWITEHIENFNAEDTKDYKSDFPKQGNLYSRGGDCRGVNYQITLNMANQLSMIENNELGNSTRKYFSAIDDAYRKRKEWNHDRASTLVGFSNLQKAFMAYRPQLLATLPTWAHGNIHTADFTSINNAILGMTSKRFRDIMELGENEPVRNAFTEQQLEYVAILEDFDADLISVMNVFDWEERNRLLRAKYNTIAVK